MMQRFDAPVAVCVAFVASAALLVGCPAPPPGPADAGAEVCASKPCTEPHRTVCSDDGAGIAVCACEPGFHDVDGACVPASVCDPNPCVKPHQTVCSLVGSAVSCGCDPGYESNGAGACVEAPADCSAEHASGDAFEPDECPAQARDIGANGTQREVHTLEPLEDVDWFKVEVPAGRIIRIQAETAMSGTITGSAWMGEPLKQVGSDYGREYGIDAAWRSPAAGTFYFRVRNGLGVPATNGYTISISDLGEDDAGDDPATARPAATDTAELGAIQFNQDLDVLSWTTEAGHSWRFDAEAAPEAPLSVLLLDPDGVQLRSSFSFSGPLSLSTRSRSAGQLFVSLGSLADRSLVPWSITATDLGSDDHADVPEEGTALSGGSAAQPGSFERDGDADVFTFFALSGHIYAFTCTPQTVADCFVTLSDPAGAVVAEDTDGLQGYVIAELSIAGTYSVRVETSPGATGTYTYQLVDLGLDDHGDNPPGATVLGMPPIMGMASGSGDIETPGDHDFLSFIADVDHIYRITCTRTGLGDCNLRVFDVNGLPLEQDTDGADALTLHLYEGGGTFYVEIYGTGAETGAYDWKIEDLFHDDHGDDLPTSTSMLANSAWVTGEIQTFTDRDWFRFATVADHAYRIVCQRVSLPDCLLTLEDASEIVLAQDVDGQDAEVVVKALAAAEDALEVAAPMGQLGTYWVKVEDLGADDCPETFAGAPPMFVNGTPANGLFEYPGDVDFRQLSLTANTTYQLTASGTLLSFTLYAADGVTAIASGTPPASFSDATSGTHYLSVRALSPTATGAYSITVSP